MLGLCHFSQLGQLFWVLAGMLTFFLWGQISLDKKKSQSFGAVQIWGVPIYPCVTTSLHSITLYSQSVVFTYVWRWCYLPQMLLSITSAKQNCSTLGLWLNQTNYISLTIIHDINSKQNVNLSISHWASEFDREFSLETEQIWSAMDIQRFSYFLTSSIVPALGN